MNSISKVYTLLLDNLTKLYPGREALNIAKIYFEDKFQIKSLSSTKNFPHEHHAVFLNDLNRFLSGEPIQYITGKTYFYKNFFTVDKSVLIPRPETEQLVDEVIKNIKTGNGIDILDIGTGSGCIALSIAKEYPQSNITAIDISQAALDIADINKNHLGVNNVTFKKMNFLNPEERKALKNFDVIVSNPPYIGVEEKYLMSSGTLDYEPEEALFPKSEDPLIFYRNIIDFAKIHLKNNGMVFCEINEYRKKEIIKLMNPSKYKFEILNDLQNKPRILKFHY